MSKPEETPVFPMFVEPVREGVYKLHGQILSGKPFRWAYWKDGEWKAFRETPQRAAAHNENRSALAYDARYIQGWSGLRKASK